HDPALLVPKGLDAAQVVALLEAAGDELEAAGLEKSPAELEERFRALAEKLGVKTGQLFGAIRVAVTGTTKAPPLFDTIVTLGVERALARIEKALEVLRRPEAA